jgi:hypothetical protein
LQQNERDRKAYATRDPYVAKQIFWSDVKYMQQEILR